MGQNSPLAAIIDTPDGRVFAKGMPSGQHGHVYPDILILARKGRAFRSRDSLIARQGGQHVLYGSTLVLVCRTDGRRRAGRGRTGQ